MWPGAARESWLIGGKRVDLVTFRLLLTSGGQEALGVATSLLAEGVAEITALTRLRRLYPVPLAAAAYEQAVLRQKALASGKFAHAAALYFTRDGLEQATGEAVARHRAARYARFDLVADLTCGIGGDALALARDHRVLAIDRDPVRLALARENARVSGLAAHFWPLCADLHTLPTPRVDALFCDPGRRTAAGRRIFSPEEYHPPLSLVTSWRGIVPALGVKISPGIDRADFPAFAAAEVEFISEGGALKEAVFWYGPLRTIARRATLLPSGATLAADGGPTEEVPCVPPGTILYEPDPAVIRAGLVEHLALMLGAAKLDPEIAYLTADIAQPTPFARAFRVLEAFPFGLKRLRARLRALDAGIVTVKKRGSPLDTDALARQLRGDGKRDLVVTLTQVRGKPYALIMSADLTV